VNSGAEAVENMMKYLINLHGKKMARRGRSPGKRRFIYFEGAFHGRTVCALNVTQLDHDPVITESFSGLVPGNLCVPFPAQDNSATVRENSARVRRSLRHIATCLRHYGDELVGIIVEPIQGAGGHRVAPKEFFQGLSRLAHEHDVFLAFDEVQTAGGQTGSVFVIDQFALPFPPQAVCTGKKFANGVVYMLNPMSDCGVLDSTWGGNLADMVRFVQEMKIVRREKLIEQVPEKAGVLVAGLERLVVLFPALIFNVRGAGLYQGFSFHKPADAARLRSMALQEENLLFLSAGPDAIRLRPMLTVSVNEIKLMLRKLERCLKKISAAGVSAREETHSAVSKS
jgi:L-lysine 6-transaminase